MRKTRIIFYENFLYRDRSFDRIRDLRRPENIISRDNIEGTLISIEKDIKKPG
jgi:hypothetical protein